MATRGRLSGGLGRTWGRPIDRRRFLRGATVVGVGTALAGGVPGIARAARVPKAPVFRLSTHGMDACQACKGHGAHKYFRLRGTIHRAHQGCNCRVLKQRISQKTWNRFFVRGDGTLRKQFDDRR